MYWNTQFIKKTFIESSPDDDVQRNGNIAQESNSLTEEENQSLPNHAVMNNISEGTDKGNNIQTFAIC